MKVTAQAPGKIILFGEHAVVYDKLGVAATVDLHSNVSIEDATDGIGIDNYGENVATNEDECKNIFERVQQLALEKNFDGITKMVSENKHNFMKYVIGSVAQKTTLKPMKISISNELRKGMGTSASISSAAVAAIAKFNSLELDIAEINRLSVLGDVFAHGGLTSGIDSNTITNGGYILFRKSEGAKRMETNIKLNIVIGDTKIRCNTAEATVAVRKLREVNEEAVEAVDRIDEISSGAANMIKNNNLEELGMLMDENQKMLRIIGVSHPKLEELIKAAKDAGALGAKLSGAGCGGIMYALVTEETQNAVARAIARAGGEAIITKLGVEGVKII
ncbi:MAG: mevalonate kinase [Candidatus Aenigmatarchaeota archaeon]